MKCETVQHGEIAERYVLGRLSEPEAGAFEDHFFTCDSCLEAVRLLQSVQAAAAQRRRSGVVAQMPGRRRVMWGAIAAVLIAGLGAAAMWRPGQQKQLATAPAAKASVPSPDWQLLARVEAPRYTPSNLRSAGAARDEKFRAAMAKYAGGDYAAAATELRGLTQGGPETAAARFYLGIAELMTGDAAAAETQLRSAAALGETPYLEEARFFLAKALLAKHDAAGAVQALDQTIALTGDREAEARRLLHQLQAR